MVEELSAPCPAIHEMIRRKPFLVAFSFYGAAEAAHVQRAAGADQILAGRWLLDLDRNNCQGSVIC